MRRFGAAEKYVRVVQGSEAVGRCVVGVTDALKVGVGLHQGSAWKRVWKGGGMLWRGVGKKSVEGGQNTSV